MTTLLEVENLQIHFGSHSDPVRAVDGIDLTIEKGETVALVGESGSGKSVTALSLARLVPTPPGRYLGGSIKYMGDDVMTMNEGALEEIRGNEISYIFQEPTVSLNPVFRVGYQIAEAILLHRRDVNVEEEVVQLLDLVGIPEPRKRMRAYPHELSGGMQQRVMIAMALACRPQLLVADEPTTALDVTIQAQILDLLQSLQRQLNMAILLITHNLGVVADVARRTYVMLNGKIVEEGPTHDVLRSPSTAYTQALLDAIPKLTGPKERLRSIRTFEVDTPADQKRFIPRDDALKGVGLEADTPLFEIHGAGVSFGKKTQKVQAVQGVDLILNRGESVGLVGESGCGKTTLGRAMMQLVSTDQGHIRFKGREIGSLRGSDLQAFRREVQMVFQDPYGSLNPRMLIGNAIEEVLKVHQVGDRKDRKEKVAYLLNAVGLESDCMFRYPHEFSGGQRQRIGIARALALEPDMLIADEPVSALDVSIQAQILNLLKDLQAQFNLSYLLISHDLAVVRYVCDRVYVMYQGNIVESGVPDEVYTNPQHPYTRSLLEAVPDVEKSLAAR